MNTVAFNVHSAPDNKTHADGQNQTVQSAVEGRPSLQSVDDHCRRHRKPKSACRTHAPLA